MISIHWIEVLILCSAGPVTLSTAPFVEKESQQSLRNEIMVLENVISDTDRSKWRSTGTILANRGFYMRISDEIRNRDDNNNSVTALIKSEGA